MNRIILASESPRKKEVFSKLGIVFETIPSSYEEDMGAKDNPKELAMFLSLGKAQNVAHTLQDDAIIIGADTFICLDGVFLGKPKNKKDAKQMLESLRGRSHKIITGVAIVDTAENIVINEALISNITMRNIEDNEIDAYIESGEPMDKAGAYAIQERGAIFVSDIQGDFFTVMGLPLFFVAEKLKERGVKIL